MNCRWFGIVPHWNRCWRKLINMSSKKCLDFCRTSRFACGLLVSTALVLGLVRCDYVLAAEPEASNKGPNIVYFLADDLGWGDVGWHGSEIQTPNLDKLATKGAKLESFYVQSVCSPTRAAFMTGRYPMRYGLQSGVIRPWAQYGLPLEEQILPQALQGAGYATAIVGKWHLGHFERNYLPTAPGLTISMATTMVRSTTLLIHGMGTRLAPQRQGIARGGVQHAPSHARSDQHRERTFRQESLLFVCALQRRPFTASGSRQVPQPIPESIGGPKAICRDVNSIRRIGRTNCRGY